MIPFGLLPRFSRLCLSSLLLAGAAAGCSPLATTAPQVALHTTAPSPPPPAVLPAPPLPSPLPSADAPPPLELTPPEVEAPPDVAPAHRAFREPTVPRERTFAVVLLYHLFGTMESRMSITPERFEEQMRWLVDNHVEIVTTAEIASFLDGTLELPEKVAAVTLDDGHLSTYAKAFPILKRLGVRFTMALNTEAIEGHRPEAVTWDNVREMVASGLCEVASHSHIHGHMERLTDDRNREEVTLSRTIIEERTKVRAETFVFPFGGHNARVMALVEQAGYRAAFAASGGAVKKDSPRWEVPRTAILKTTTIGEFARKFRTAEAAHDRRPAEAMAAAQIVPRSG